jgi:hypothetical protein
MPAKAGIHDCLFAGSLLRCNKKKLVGYAKLRFANPPYGRIDA